MRVAAARLPGVNDSGSCVDGAAERLLGVATDVAGHHPLPWVAAPLLGADRVLDLCCGTGPLADHLPAGRWIGLDAVPGPRRPLLRGAPTSIPLRDNAVDGLAMMLVLPRLPDLDAVFAEVRRVLRPGGTLVLLVPSASVRSLRELRAARLLGPVHRTGWPHRSALDRAGWLLQAADFAVLGDDRVSFALPVPDADGARRLVADLPRAGLWPPGAPADVLATASARLAGRAGAGVVLPVPLRRIVARR
ncbi:MAG: Methyltransferase type 11 [Pseudonocardia sp.]|nr:Methyltransferase type 11 [Pseudonocardia sp.]